jgi:hypothetical protein
MTLHTRQGRRLSCDIPPVPTGPFQPEGRRRTHPQSGRVQGTLSTWSPIPDPPEQLYFVLSERLSAAGATRLSISNVRDLPILHVRLFDFGDRHVIPARGEPAGEAMLSEEHQWAASHCHRTLCRVEWHRDQLQTRPRPPSAPCFIEKPLHRRARRQRERLQRPAGAARAGRAPQRGRRVRAGRGVRARDARRAR